MSDVFRIYLTIVAVALAAAFLILMTFSRLLKKDVSKVWAIYRGWLVMIPLIALSLYFGRLSTIGLITLLTLAGFLEFARASGLDRDRFMIGAVLLAILATSTTAFMLNPFDGSPGWFPMFLAMPVYAIGLLLMVPILRNRAKGQLRIVSLAIVAYLYICWMFGHLAHLANSPHAQGCLLFLFFAVELNDIAAFTFGKFFGSHPLRSEISPNKTWEGAIGALAVSMVLPWLLAFSLPEEFAAPQLLLTGLIVGVGGQMGDLTISFIKRDLEIKDMGAAIPGHGGVLDRIDSLIFTSPFFVHMLNYEGLL